MSSYPKIEQLFNAIIEDCYNYLLDKADNSTKKSIESLKETIKDKAETNKKAYVVFCSIGNEKPEKGKLSSIYDFTIKYIECVYYYLNDLNVNIINDRIAEKSDFCNCYITLFGYVYIFNGCFENEVLLFDYKNFKCFEKILVNNKISKIIKNIYIDTVNKFYKKEGIKINNESFKEFTAHFEDSFQHKEEKIEIEENKINESPKNSNIEIKTEELSDNGNKSAQLDTCDTSNIQNGNKILDIGENTSKIESNDNENDMRDVKKEILQSKMSAIEDRYYNVQLLENIILSFEFHSPTDNCGKKKIEYLENLIISLKNTITNLGNPYNYNLWRKLSNIILKNLFVILHKKNYKFLQYYSKSVLNSLKHYEFKLKGEQLNSFKKKLDEYETKLKKQNEEISSKGAPAADKDRYYNIIVVENQIKYTLVIDFLFFLKEKGNKMNHFDEEIIDLILFDDLNIDININKDSNGKEEISVQPEKEKIQKGEKINQGKYSFNCEEIIDMFKNPFKYHKKDINIDNIYSAVYAKIQEIKTKNKYVENEKKFNELKNIVLKLIETIQKAVVSYEKYFNKYKINYQIKNESEILDPDEKENIKNYNYIKALKGILENKLKLYDNNIVDLSNLNTIVENSMKEVDDFIEEIKLKGQTKENKLKSISELFLEFKNTLKVRIVNEQEYGKYDKIFNDKNIEEFSLEDVYSILKETLNYNNASFSIIKKDITNFNLLIVVITEYNELKNFVYNQDLDILI